MHKGQPRKLDGDAFAAGMLAAYEYSIGTLANPITKLWSKADFGDEDAEHIKVLTAAANFYTDYAKTLYTPQLPASINNTLRDLSYTELPHYWLYTDNYNHRVTALDKAEADADARRKYAYDAAVASELSDEWYGSKPGEDVDEDDAQHTNMIGGDNDTSDVDKDKLPTPVKKWYEKLPDNQQQQYTTNQIICKAYIADRVQKGEITGTQYVGAGVSTTASSTSLVDAISDELGKQSYIKLDWDTVEDIELDYKTLLHVKSVKPNKQIIDVWTSAYKDLAPVSGADCNSYYAYCCLKLKAALDAVEPDPYKQADTITYYLFTSGKPTRKAMYWSLYGNIIVKNIQNNLSGKRYCAKCMSPFTPNQPNQIKCSKCTGHTKAVA